MGVTWYDVAPSYGDGMAEGILAEFLASRRGRVNVCTKVGLRASTPVLKAVLRPVARVVVSRLPTLRKLAAHSRRVTRVPLEAEQIARSVDQSLRHLRVDQLDALLLHDPIADDVERPDIADALLDLRNSGKVRAVGVAGSAEAAQRAIKHPSVFSIIQLANNVFEPNASQSWLEGWRNSGGMVITHSAFGSSKSLSTLTRLIEVNATARAILVDAGYQGSSSEIAANFLTDYAIETNKKGICLFSAMKAHHLTALLQRIEAHGDQTASAVATIGAALLKQATQTPT